jgi:hypothetical protein
LPTLGVIGWLITAALPFYTIAAAVTYFEAEAETLPPDADSSGIPIFGAAFVAIIATFVMGVIDVLVFRRGRSKARFLAWDAGRPLISAFVTVVCGGGAVGLGIVSLLDAGAFGRLPAIEFIWEPIPVGLALWLLCIRAAALTP